MREIPKTTRTDGICVIATNERLYCAGINQYGEFGNGGTTYYQTTPVPFCGASCSNTNLNGSHTKIISAHAGGFGNICVVTHDITGGIYNYAYCAGNNGSGRLGDGTTTSRSSPILFATGQVQINQAYSNNGITCAASYVVYCAGYNSSSQLADGTTTTRMTPVQSFGGSLGVLKIYNFYSSNCAIFISTEMWCTGDNNYGKLGNGTTGNTIAMARFAVSGGGVKDFDIGTIAICALTTSGSVYCAGWNGAGEFGNGTTTNSTTPVKYNIPNGASAVDWSFTDTVVCVVGSDANAYCSGRNTYGSLGDDTMTDRSTPVKFQLTSS